MTTLTLLTKVYNADQLKQIDETLRLSFEELSVDAKILGTLGGGWVQVAVSGEDESVATNYIAKELGVCPTSLDGVKPSSSLKGYVSNLEKSREELSMDVGIFQPKSVHATIPLSHLQDKLAGGRKIALKKIAELWGISENLPLTIKVVKVDSEGNCLEAELAEEQLEKYRVWRESLLDRLLIVGVSLLQVKTAVEQAQLDRDVIDIESLGMFEHALVCKLGTDAAGLILRIGRRLRKARFTVFNPKITTKFLEL